MQPIGATGFFVSKQESVAIRETRIPERTASLCREHPQPARGVRTRLERLPILMVVHIKRVPVIHTRTPKVSVRDCEAERMNEVQPATGHRAQSSDISCVRRNLGLKEDYVKHRPSLSLYCRRVDEYQRQIENQKNSDHADTIKKLVIVDDERAFTALLEEVLSVILTCPVVTFTSPKAALAYIQREPIGMLVTDYYMPEMSGIELVRALEEAQPGVPAILVTGHQLDNERKATETLISVRNIIQKPFGWKLLAQNVVKHWALSPAPTLRA